MLCYSDEEKMGDDVYFLMGWVGFGGVTGARWRRLDEKRHGQEKLKREVKMAGALQSQTFRVTEGWREDEKKEEYSLDWFFFMWTWKWKQAFINESERSYENSRRHEVLHPHICSIDIGLTGRHARMRARTHTHTKKTHRRMSREPLYWEYIFKP